MAVFFGARLAAATARLISFGVEGDYGDVPSTYARFDTSAEVLPRNFRKSREIKGHRWQAAQSGLAYAY